MNYLQLTSEDPERAHAISLKCLNCQAEMEKATFPTHRNYKRYWVFECPECKALVEVEVA